MGLAPVASAARWQPLQWRLNRTQLGRAGDRLGRGGSQGVPADMRLSEADPDERPRPSAGASPRPHERATAIASLPYPRARRSFWDSRQVGTPDRGAAGSPAAAGARSTASLVLMRARMRARPRRYRQAARSAAWFCRAIFAPFSRASWRLLTADGASPSARCAGPTSSPSAAFRAPSGAAT